MKYTIAIIVSTVMFTMLGLVAAWGVVAYSPESSRASTIDTFAMFCFGGGAAGLIVGCIAALLGRMYSKSDSGAKGP